MVLKVDVPADAVSGGVDEGFGPVAEAFRRNFAERGEIGAACAAYRDGRKVVDLWGGYRDGDGTPRSVAKAYGEFATGGRTLALRDDTLDALRRPAVAPTGGRMDVVLHIESVFSLGYVKPFPRFRLYDDPRELALRKALYRCL